MVRATLGQREICRAIGVAESGERTIEGVSPLGAHADQQLYFINRRVTVEIRDSLAARQGCIVLAPIGSALPGELGDCVVLEVDDPRRAIANVLAFIRDSGRQQPWVAQRWISADAVVSPLAVVDGNVEIGAGSIVEPFSTIGPDVVIGQGTIIRTGARIGPRVSIGDRSIIGPNAVVGFVGYGFVRGHDGNKRRIPHLGGTVIGSDVEIGATTCVQAGTIAPTIIEDHAKIDDHVFIGHNARVGRSASLVAGVVIGGSSIVGADAWVGMNATIRNGRGIGKRSLVGMDASVQKDLPDAGLARAPAAVATQRVENDPASIGFPDPRY